MRLDLLWTSVLAALLCFGCAGESIDGGDNSSSQQAGDNADNDSSNSGDENTSDDLAPVPICVTGCDTPADCDIYNGQYSAYDASHYICSDGGCTWLGCNSHAECAEIQPNYRCHPMPFTDFKSCVPGCASDSDCGYAAAGTHYDQDNYRCDEGACVYSGCNNDLECQENLGAASTCVDPFNIGQTTCYTSCSTSADCGTSDASAAYDADNHSCENGLCIYTGCRNDQECEETYEGMICLGG
jgi:hypothetical protein